MSEDITFYELESGKYSYYVSIKMTRNLESKLPTSYTVNVGGKMKGCVEILVEVPNPNIDDRFKFMEEAKNTAYIIWIGYSQKCSIKGDLEKGQGTRHMIRSALTLVCKMYKWITKFSLIDASSIKCKEGVTVNLAIISLALKGQTY